jgi:hypothetical protein
MNYLFRYLTTLKPDELARLRELELSPRERETFELLVSLRGRSEPTKHDATERLAMSGSMFDKACSTLLRRFLEEMVPGGGIALLEHLVEQTIYDLFLHELRRQEKEHLAHDNKKQLTAFYADAFTMLHLRFSSDYNERIARSFAAKYRRLDPSPDTAIYIEASLLNTAIWTEASRRTGDPKRLEQRLLRNDARITSRTAPRVRHRQLKAWINYYGQLKRNPEERMRSLREAVDLCEKHPEIFSQTEKVMTLCQIAEEHYFYHTDLLTPLRMYRELYKRYPDILRNEKYHTNKYIQLCLSNGEYHEAEELLVSYFGTEANLEVHGGGSAKSIALLWAKLSLLTDRLDDARRHIDDAILLNQKQFYVQFEVECRMLHTALSFLAGDFDLVERRLSAHIKYLRSKEITYTTSRFYPWFFKLVGAFVEEQTTGKPLSQKLEAKMEEFMEGAAAQYGVLLRKLRGMKETVGV